MNINIPSPKLLDQVRDLIRTKHYSIRTEASYRQSIKRFIWFTTSGINERWRAE